MKRRCCDLNGMKYHHQHWFVVWRTQILARNLSRASRVHIEVHLDELQNDADDACDANDNMTNT